MNRYEFKGNIKKGRTSQVARQAYADMMSDDCTIVHVDYDRPGVFKKVHRILDEDKIGIKI